MASLDAINMNLGKRWETVRDREAWRAEVHGVTKSRTGLVDWTTTIYTYSCVNFISSIRPWTPYRQETRFYFLHKLLQTQHLEQSMGNLTYEEDWFISAIFSTSLSFDHQGICPLLGRKKKNKPMNEKRWGGGNPTVTNVSHVWTFYSIRGTNSYHPHFRLLIFVIRVGTRRLEKASISKYDVSDIKTSPEHLQGPPETVDNSSPSKPVLFIFKHLTLPTQNDLR